MSNGRRKITNLITWWCPGIPCAIWLASSWKHFTIVTCVWHFVTKEVSTVVLRMCLFMMSDSNTLWVWYWTAYLLTPPEQAPAEIFLTNHSHGLSRSRFIARTTVVTEHSAHCIYIVLSWPGTGYQGSIRNVWNISAAISFVLCMIFHCIVPLGFHCCPMDGYLGWWLLWTMLLWTFMWKSSVWISVFISLVESSINPMLRLQGNCCDHFLKWPC